MNKSHMPLRVSNAAAFHRFAAYYAPEQDSTLWQAGNRWLGLDPQSGQALLPSISGRLPGPLQPVMDAPRRYGWHATLKAPFSLAPGVTVGALHEAMQALCSLHRAFVMPLLKVQRLDNFLALVPAQASPEIQDVSDACVMTLHPLAQALPPSEVQRRRGGGLSDEQEHMLQQWGYPHVLKQFQFHMSLTGSLAGVSAVDVQLLIAQAQAIFEDLAPTRFDGVALVGESVSGAAFNVLHRYPFSA